MAEKWFNVPKDITVADFPFDGSQVIEIKSTEKVNDAFHKLAKHNILSAPVWDEKKQDYLGFIDMADIMTMSFGVDLICELLPKEMLHPEQLKAQSETLVGEIFESEEKRNWNPVTQETPFSDVLRILGKGSSCRRVPVIDPNTKKCIKIISQSAIVNILYKSLQHIKDNKILNSTPKELGNFGVRDVVSVGMNQQVRDAFMEMGEKNISSVAVINDEEGGNNALFSCISTKDIRFLPRIENAGLLPGGSMLKMPVIELIKMLRTKLEPTGKARPSVVCCHVDTKLINIIGKLAETKMHRVYMEDNNRKVIGVISVSDIVAFLVSQMNDN